ncbi:T9SS type A sorting domain-containing protein [Pontibacter populi]|uniref:T9SS type A sorting domain-containing protein n=1 Tax=Pontibacter populi TaxID=890055 RepID=A0ABV1RNW7_9BACT
MKQLLLLFCLLLCFTSASATHIMGGFITYTQDASPNANPRKYLFKLTLIADRWSYADDPVVDIDMGDGDIISVERTSVTAISRYFDREEFLWEHTFPVDGTFTASWKGINRNPGVLNFPQPTDRVNVLIMTTVNVRALVSNTGGPQFLAPEFISASVGQSVNFNLLAYDADGDSLTYKLSYPLHIDEQGKRGPLPGYLLPDNVFDCRNVAGSAPSSFGINKRDGQLVWDAPCIRGDYVFAVLVEEWRGKLKISQTTYDMTIRVDDKAENSITLLNREDLQFTHNGIIEAKANQELKLKIKYKELIPALAPLQNDANAVTVHLASELTQVLKVPVTYFLETSVGGETIGTFSFTPTETLIRDKPYFISFYGVNETYPLTLSLGILVRSDEPMLKLIETEKLRLISEERVIITHLNPVKLTVLADNYQGHVTTLTAVSSLTEQALRFDFTTQDTTAGMVGRLIFQPNKTQVSNLPQTITFRATYYPAGGATTTPLVKELKVQLVFNQRSQTELPVVLETLRLPVYPNPAKDRFMVQAESPSKLIIYTLQGKFLMEQDVPMGISEIRPKVAAGLYFYSLTNQNGLKKTGKLILE